MWHALPVDACVISARRRSHLTLDVPRSDVPEGWLWCRLVVAQRDVHKHDAAAEVVVILYASTMTTMWTLPGALPQKYWTANVQRRRTDDFRGCSFIPFGGCPLSAHGKWHWGCWMASQFHATCSVHILQGHLSPHAGMQRTVLLPGPPLPESQNKWNCKGMALLTGVTRCYRHPAFYQIQAHLCCGCDFTGVMRTAHASCT